LNLEEGKYFNDNLSKGTVPAYFLYRDVPEAQRRGMVNDGSTVKLRAIMGE